MHIKSIWPVWSGVLSSKSHHSHKLKSLQSENNTILHDRGIVRIAETMDSSRNMLKKCRNAIITFTSQYIIIMDITSCHLFCMQTYQIPMIYSFLRNIKFNEAAVTTAERIILVKCHVCLQASSDLRRQLGKKDEGILFVFLVEGLSPLSMQNP